MRTGSIKFDSIGQRLSLALSMSLIVSAAVAVRQMAEEPPDLIVQRVAYLVLVVFWGVKVFIDDQQDLVPGKAGPAIDLIMLLLSQGALICAATLVHIGEVTFWILCFHLVVLIVWNLLALAADRRGVARDRHIGRWIATDLAELGILMAIGYLVAQPMSSFVGIATLFVSLIADIYLSDTFTREKLIGEERIT